MHKFLEDTPVRVICQACGKAHEKKMKWIKKNKALKCKKCGKKTDLARQDVRKSVKQVAQAISDFEKALGRLQQAAVKTNTRKSSPKRVRRPAQVEAAATPAAAAAVKEKRSFV